MKRIKCVIEDDGPGPSRPKPTHLKATHQTDVIMSDADDDGPMPAAFVPVKVGPPLRKRTKLDHPDSPGVQGMVKVKVEDMQTLTRSLERLKVIVTEREKTTTGLLQQVTQMREDMKVLQEDVELMVEMTVNDIREVLLEYTSNSPDNSPTPPSCRPPKKKRRSG